MRFRQLQKKSNVVVRKKMYKSGKNWIVKSSLAIIGGVTLFGISQTVNVKADTVPVGQADTVKEKTSDTITENTSSLNKQSTNEDGQNSVTPDAPQNLPVNPVQKDQSTVTSTDNIDENHQKSDINVSQTDTSESGTDTSVGSSTVGNNADADPNQAQSSDTVPTLDKEQSGDFGVHWYTDKGTLHLGSGTLKDVPHNVGGSPLSTWPDNVKKSTTKIVFDGPVKANTNLDSLFAQFANLTEIVNLPLLDTSDTTVFSSMFQGDFKLEKIDLTNFDTSKAESIRGLFWGNASLKSLDVSKFDVSNINDFSQIFSNCKSLKDINISNWDMGRATNFNSMFQSDISMESVELPNSITSTRIDPNSKMNFDNMFNSCIALKSLDLSNLNMTYFHTTAENFLQYAADPWGKRKSNLTVLTLSSLNNLGHSKLSTSLRESNDGTQYAAKWKVVKTVDGTTPLGTEKESYELDSMYDGANRNGAKTTWELMFKDYIDLTVRYIADDSSKALETVPEKRLRQEPLNLKSLNELGKPAEGYDNNFEPKSIQVDSEMNGKVIDVRIPVYVIPVYAPMNFNIIEKDTNDKMIDEIDFEIPVGKPVSDTSKIDKISNKKMILQTKDSGKKYSYIEVLDRDGNSASVEPLTEADISEADAGDTARSIAKYFLDGDFSNGVGPYQSGLSFVIHAYYKPEKTQLSGSHGSTHTHSSSHSSSNVVESVPELNVETKKETIATYADKSNVKIYDTDGKELINKSISPNTDWFSDEILTSDGKKYYRIATDEWLKAADVYAYSAEQMLVRVYQDTPGDLVEAEGNSESDRELKPATDWKSDQYTYINGEKYYRVATNEFVSANRVYEYKNINDSLTTKSAVSLYNERGQNLSSELPVNTTYKIDLVVAIDGQNYYRIAENEFVKANDDIVLN